MAVGKFLSRINRWSETIPADAVCPFCQQPVNHPPLSFSLTNEYVPPVTGNELYPVWLERYDYVVKRFVHDKVAHDDCAEAAGYEEEHSYW